jgi:hypothetical protein
MAGSADAAPPCPKFLGPDTARTLADAGRNGVHAF